MKTVIAITGASGAMGGEALEQLLDLPGDFLFRVFLFNKEKHTNPFFRHSLRKGKDRIEIERGDLAVYDDAKKLVEGADYVIHCAALIPPKSDHDEEGAYRSDYLATKNLVDAVNSLPDPSKVHFVYVGTVAEYGNRNLETMWGRVGDPVISSDYDCYSLNKIRAERYLLEHKPVHFVSLRQTAIAHKYLFKNNMEDGLMFHTTWNGPLEWVSDRDSGRLIVHLIEEDLAGDLHDFWDKIYDIGGGLSCRATGYESIAMGMELMGRTPKDFYSPEWNVTRNFHGMYFLDSDLLEEKLHFREDSLPDFWKRMGKKYWYFHLAKIVPPSIIKSLVFKPLLKNDNSPAYWVNHDFKGHIKAFYGSEEAYKSLPKTWKTFFLLGENQDSEGHFVDNEAMKKSEWALRHGLVLNHGFDESKPVSSLGIEDMKAAAAYRGGECLSETMTEGDMWTKLKWRCAEGHVFEASPFAILFGGFWCPLCEDSKPWAMGKLASKSPFFAQVYFADHSKNEASDTYPLSLAGGRD